MGFLPIDDEFRHPECRRLRRRRRDRDRPARADAVPAGVPKTGQMSETMAKVAAHNIAADIQGGPRPSLPIADLPAICVLDAGNNGTSSKRPRPRPRPIRQRPPAQRLYDGRPEAHWAKLAFERYFPPAANAASSPSNEGTCIMSTVTDLTTDTFEQAVAGPGITVIDFWAPGAAPAASMAPQPSAPPACAPTIASPGQRRRATRARRRVQIRSIPTSRRPTRRRAARHRSRAHCADDLVTALDKAAA